MTSQTISSYRRSHAMLVFAVVALLALGATATAVAKPAHRTRSTQRCGEGYKLVTKVVRKHGQAEVVRVCKKIATKPTVSPLSADLPASPLPRPAAGPSIPPPATTTAPEVHATVGPGFSQNPLVPNEVTWHYSASATRTVTSNGTTQTETVPLPEGRLAFFVDGKLECEINAGGAIAASACTVDVQQLGAHEVETIFSAGPLSSTSARTDYVGRYPTSTNLQVSVEPTAPEYLDIGPNAYGFEQYAFEVGRLRITGSGASGSNPTFSCEGQPVGCLVPDATFNRNGTASLPLYAQHRLNMATGQEEWHVGFDAYSPALRESGWFWQFPNEAVGTQFFHAVTDPDPALYEPSSTTVPLNLNGGHYPFYRWFKNGEAGGSVAAVEGTARPALTLGTYEKFDGPETWLHTYGRFYTAAGEGEGCVYRLRIDGLDLNEDRRATSQGFEILNGFPGFSAGPHTLELWVERRSGSGPGNCAISSGTFEAYEVIH